MADTQSAYKQPDRDTAALDRLARAARLTQPLTLAAERLLPVLPALAPLLPDGGLRRGSTVLVRGSTALALALAAGPSAAGAWVAAACLPDLGLLAAAEAGIALERLALIPDVPPDRWQAVLAALVDGVGVVLAGAPARLDAPTARRLAARARERGTVLIPVERWPDRADLTLTLEAGRWHGLGQGHGHLRARTARVVATGRALPPAGRDVHLWLPPGDMTGAYAAPALGAATAGGGAPPRIPVPSAMAVAWGLVGVPEPPTGPPDEAGPAAVGAMAG